MVGILARNFLVVWLGLVCFAEVLNETTFHPKIGFYERKPASSHTMKLIQNISSKACPLVALAMPARKNENPSVLRPENPAILSQDRRKGKEAWAPSATAAVTCM